MEVSAKLKYLRIAPRKVRLVADLIRGKSVDEAIRVLSFTRKRAAQPILKLLNSAIANAVHNFRLNKDKLYISKITVDEGPKLKRWRPRARGMAYEIQKKTSHITLVLTEAKTENQKSNIQTTNQKK
ncbi:50S ribosomal protein L22 [bacterium]|nr:50S ribosomal protein L22 [bacterium]